MILLTLVTPAATLPATIEECKKDLRIQHGVDDDYIEGLIQAASAYVGGINGVLGGKVLTAETWEYKTSLPSTVAVLPLTPVQGVTSMQYYDTDNALQTLDLDDFTLYSDEDCAYIEPNAGVSWPPMFSRIDALIIEFVAGFDTVPDNLKKAVRFIVAYWFENRTLTSDRAVNEIPMAAESLINISRKGWVAG